MEREYLNINEAYLVLNQGLVVIDNTNTRFKIIDNKIIVKNDNSRFSLEENEFLTLYKNSKFLLLEDSEQIIDTKKDDEYYNFKHK